VPFKLRIIVAIKFILSRVYYLALILKTVFHLLGNCDGQISQSIRHPVFLQIEKTFSINFKPQNSINHKLHSLLPHAIVLTRLQR